MGDGRSFGLTGSTCSSSQQSQSHRRTRPSGVAPAIPGPPHLDGHVERKDEGPGPAGDGGGDGASDESDPLDADAVGRKVQTVHADLQCAGALGCMLTEWDQMCPAPPPPPPSGGAEFLEAPKKIFGLNQLAPKAPEKVLDRPKARRKIWPDILRGGVWVGGMGPPPTPPPQVAPSC